MAQSQSHHSVAPPETNASFKTWVIVLAGLAGAFMAVLNIQLTNASLRDIEGGIGTGNDNGAWISTAYLIGEIIIIPLTDYLSRVFSFRRFLLANACLFLTFSMACAFAHSLGEMIVFRAIQGVAGGVLIPMAFTLILTKLPKSQQAIGMAMFAITATFSPAIGPTIGGYITENYGWSYIFFINLVPGFVMIAVLSMTLERQPMQLNLLKEGDWFGIITLAIGVGAMQTVLEEGNKDDWFGSPFIIKLTIVSIIFIGAFIWIELTTKKPAVHLKLLARRNFGFGSLSNLLLGFGLYGSVYLLPQYLSQVQGYNSQQIGSVMAWTGLPQLLIIPFVPALMRKIDTRLIVCGGLCLFAVSCFMNTHMSFIYSGDQFWIPNIVRAIGQAGVLTPLTGIAMVGVNYHEAAAASGVFNMVRNLGGAFGTAALATIVTKREQFHSNIIGNSVSLLDGATRDRLDFLTNYFVAHGVSDSGAARHKAIAVIGRGVARQSFVMGYSDTFAVLGVLMTIAAFSILLTQRAKATSVAVH